MWDVEYVSAVLFCFILDIMLCCVWKNKIKIVDNKNLSPMFVIIYLCYPLKCDTLPAGRERIQRSSWTRWDRGDPVQNEA